MTTNERAFEAMVAMWRDHFSMTTEYPMTGTIPNRVRVAENGVGARVTYEEALDRLSYATPRRTVLGEEVTHLVVVFESDLTPDFDANGLRDWLAAEVQKEAVAA